MNQDNVETTKSEAASWFVQIEGRSIYGPFDLSVLQEWVTTGQLLASHQLSTDQEHWVTANSIPALEMDWIVEGFDESDQDSFHIASVEKLLKRGILTPGSFLVNRKTSRRIEAREWERMISAPDAVPKKESQDVEELAKLKEDLARLREKLGKVTAESNKHEREYHEALLRVTDLEQKLLKSNAALEYASDELKDVQAQYAAIKQHVNMLEERIQTINDAHAESLQDEKSRHAEAGVALAEAQEANAQADEKIEAIERDKAELERTLAETREQQNEDDHLLAALRQERDHAKAEIEQLSKKLEALSEEHVSAINVEQSRVTKLEEELQEAVAAQAQSERKCKDLEAQQVVLQSTFAKAQEANAQADEKIEAIEREKIELERTLAETREQQNEDDHLLAALRQERDHAKVETEQLSKKLEALSEEHVSAINVEQSRVTRLEEELQEAVAAQAQSEQKRKDLEAQQVVLQSTFAKGQESQRTIASKLEALQQERDRAKETADELAEEIEKIRDDVAAAIAAEQTRATTAEEALKKAQVANGEAEAQLQAMQIAKASLEEQLGAEHDKQLRIVSELEAYKAKSNAAADKVQQFEKTMDALVVEHTAALALEEKRAAEAEASLHKTEDATKTLEDALHAAQEAKTQAEHNLKDVEKQKSIIEQALTAGRAKQEETGKHLQALEQERDDAIQQANGFKQQVAKLTEAHGKALGAEQSRIAQLHEQLTKAQRESEQGVNAMAEERACALKQVEDARKQNAALAKTLAALEKDRDAANATISDLNAQMETLTEEHKVALHAEMTRTQELQVQLSDLTKQAAAHKAERDDVLKMVKALKQDAQDAHMAHRASLDAEQARATKFKNQLREAVAAQAQSEQKRKDLEAQQVVLQTTFAKEHESQGAIASNLEALRQERDRAKETADELAQELEKIRDDVATAIAAEQTRASTAEEALKKAQAANAEIEAQLQVIQTTKASLEEQLSAEHDKQLSIVSELEGYKTKRNAADDQAQQFDKTMEALVAEHKAALAAEEQRTVKAETNLHETQDAKTALENSLQAAQKAQQTSEQSVKALEQDVANLSQRLEQQLASQKPTPSTRTTEEKWFLKIEDGRVFGPVALQDLAEWATQLRVGPDHMVSTDKENWLPTHEVDALHMDWMIALDNDVEYGPIHFLAVQEIINDGIASKNATLRNRCTGQLVEAQRLMHPETVAVIREMDLKLRDHEQHLREFQTKT